MRSVSSAWSNRRFIEIEHNFRRKKFNRPKYVTNFLKSSFCYRGNIKKYKNPNIKILYWYIYIYIYIWKILLTHPKDPCPVLLRNSLYPLHFFHFTLCGQIFPLFCSNLGGLFPPHPPRPSFIHGYFEALLATVVFKVKIEFQRKGWRRIKDSW